MYHFIPHTTPNKFSDHATVLTEFLGAEFIFHDEKQKKNCTTVWTVHWNKGQLFLENVEGIYYVLSNRRISHTNSTYSLLLRGTVPGICMVGLSKITGKKLSKWTAFG
jgi:hypothetical protein